MKTTSRTTSATKTKKKTWGYLQRVAMMRLHSGAQGTLEHLLSERKTAVL